MAAAPEPLLMTVEEFSRLPERDDVIQELHWGFVVTLPPPKKLHQRVQSRLINLLTPHSTGKGFLSAELAFRSVPEYDVRIADIAFASNDRWDRTSDNDYLHGSPELVIEVLSPSNTKREIAEKAALCLSTGTEEFWIVDPAKCTITVMTPGDRDRVYVSGNQVPVRTLGCTLAVSDIFNVP